MHSSGGVRLIQLSKERTVKAIGGWKGPEDPIPLNDGRFLRISITLYLEETKDKGPRVKVSKSSFQYQADKLGDKWIFRYDYVRQPPDPHPADHLHINGSLAVPCLRDGQLLSGVHFPTDRIAIEAVIRLLIEQFGVPCNRNDVWRSVLAESEALFKDIRHQSISGPPK